MFVFIDSFGCLNPFTCQTDWHQISPYNKGNNHQIKKLLIFKQNLLTSTLGNIQRTVWRICILILEYKGVTLWSTFNENAVCLLVSHHSLKLHDWFLSAWLRLDLFLVHKFLVFIITWASCGKACYYMGFLQKSPYIAYRIQSFHKGTFVVFAQALITRLPMPSMDEIGQFVAKSCVLLR